MRVTKTIKEYIEKKVDEKISAKYEAEKLEAERQTKIENEILEAASKAALEVFAKTIKNAVANIDFLEINEECFPTCYRSNAISIKDKCYVNSVHRWTTRKNKEVKEKVDDIIVALELGGTKADLDKMLSEI